MLNVGATVKMFSCEICDRQFLYKNSVNRHFRREHINKESRRRLKCTECEHECRFYQNLRTHIYVEHGIVCKVFRKTFLDFEEFKIWKRKFEESTHYMYVKHSSPKTSQATRERKTYFVCHRTGTFQSGSCGKRKLKRQGSNKINASCPSTMEVVESLADGSVKLVLWKTHAGHDAEVSRTFLSSNERNWLAARISEGASYQKIMNEIQNLGSKGSRMCYIKSQDIRNMRKHLINSRNRVILSDIRSWVKSTQNLNYCYDNPVIFFKDRNSADIQQILSGKDIMLIIMTEFQESAFSKSTPKIICLDDTHCQENYDYHLISLYGTNEGRSWFPIVYCFTNVVNSNSLQYFLSKVKDRLGAIQCSALVCDDSPMYYEAWCNIMSTPEHFFLHLWYVEKNWLENVSKVKCTETVRLMVYGTMKLLLSEKSEPAFEKRLAIFQDSLKSDTRLAEFLDFFVSDYVTRTRTWGGCYRKSIGLDAASESALDKLHTKLNDEFNSKLDDQNIKACLNTLITISHSCEAVLKHIFDISKYEDEERMRRIRTGHRRGICIKRSQVIETSGTQYQVSYKSENSRNETFDVRYLGAKKCKCVLRCNTCTICIHHYICTCVDYVANFNICEHIHACAIIRNDIMIDLSAETDAPLDSFVEEVICEEEIICNVDLLMNEDGVVDEISHNVDVEDEFEEEEFNESSSDISIVKSNNSEVTNTTEEFILDDTLVEANEELNLSSTSDLYYEPFTFISTNEMNDYGQAELQLTEDGLQIVAFQNENEYETVLVNDDSSSFGDVSSVYEDVIPSSKGSIIALGFSSEGSDGYIFRGTFETNTIIKHKVDTLFTLNDFENIEENEIGKQLSSQMISIDNQDFENCYTSYDPNDDIF